MESTFFISTLKISWFSSLFLLFLCLNSNGNHNHLLDKVHTHKGWQHLTSSNVRVAVFHHTMFLCLGFFEGELAWASACIFVEFLFSVCSFAVLCCLSLLTQICWENTRQALGKQICSSCGSWLASRQTTVPLHHRANGSLYALSSPCCSCTRAYTTDHRNSQWMPTFLQVVPHLLVHIQTDFMGVF